MYWHVKYCVHKYGLYSGQWEETQRKLTRTQNQLPNRQQTGNVAMLPSTHLLCEHIFEDKCNFTVGSYIAIKEKGFLGVNFFCPYI